VCIKANKEASAAFAGAEMFFVMISAAAMTATAIAGALRKMPSARQSNCPLINKRAQKAIADASRHIAREDMLEGRRDT
jgi:hypothetical protein